MKRGESVSSASLVLLFLDRDLFTLLLKSIFYSFLCEKYSYPLFPFQHVLIILMGKE